MSAPHTPGPWAQDASDEYSIIAADGSVVATVLTGADFPCLDDGEQMAIIPECEANAHLIAAAPEMYKALAGVLDALNENMISSVVDREPILAALAKARGEA